MTGFFFAASPEFSSYRAFATALGADKLPAIRVSTAARCLSGILSTMAREKRHSAGYARMPLERLSTTIRPPRRVRKSHLLALLSGVALLTFTYWIIEFPLQAAEEKIALSWEPMGDDIESSRYTTGSNGMFSSDLVLIRSSLTRYRIGVIRASEYSMNRATVRALCERSKALVCINASFFDEAGRPLGLLVSRGITLQNVHRGGKTLTGIFQATRKDITIVNRADFNPSSVIEAVQAGPRLIHDGQLVPGLKESSSHSSRAGVCIDAQGRALLYHLSTGVFGLSLDDLRALLVDPAIGCRDALNLDGGGSAQLFVSGQVQGSAPIKSALSREGTDEVPVALGLFMKSPR